MSPRPLLLAALLLAACGEKSAAPPPPPSPPPEAPEAAVPALDEFGPFEGRVNDIAFWIHPSVPFNSMAIAATDAGLVALNIEDGKEVARIEGLRAGAAEVIYEDVYSLTDSDGYKARGILLARDEDRKSIRFFEIHNATRTLTELDGAFDAGDIDAWCSGPQFLGPTRLVTIGGGKMRTYDVEFGKNSASVVPTTLEGQYERESRVRARGCVIGKQEGELFVLYETGEIARFIEQTRRRLEVFAATRIRNATGIDLVLNGAASDGDDSDCCGQVGVLDSDAALVRLLDYDDGTALGGIGIKSSFDVEAVEAATAFGLGQGNFGGPYRNGVLALATGGEKPVIRLAALNGALEALAVNFGDAHNPRTLNPNPLEYQCKEQEKREGEIAACAPYGEGAFPPPLALPEFTPPPLADTSLNAPEPASEE